MKRRTFLKTALVASGLLAAPVIAKPQRPEFTFDDIGPRGIGKITEPEQRAVKHTCRSYFPMDNIGWGIPGNRSNVQRFTTIGDNYLVTWKLHPNMKKIYIEVERTFTGNPSPLLVEWINGINILKGDRHLQLPVKF